MLSLIKSTLAFSLLYAAAVFAGDKWVPGTAAGEKLEYVTLNTNSYAIDSLSEPWIGKTRIEFGFESDTTTYFIPPKEFQNHNERAMELYRTLRDAMINAIPVNVQVNTDSRELYQIRLGSSAHPLAIRRQSGNGTLDAETRAVRIDLLGRSGKSMPALSWQGIASAQR